MWQKGPAIVTQYGTVTGRSRSRAPGEALRLGLHCSLTSPSAQFCLFHPLPQGSRQELPLKTSSTLSFKPVSASWRAHSAALDFQRAASLVAESCMTSHSGETMGLGRQGHQRPKKQHWNAGWEDLGWYWEGHWGNSPRASFHPEAAAQPLGLEEG